MYAPGVFESIAESIHPSYHCETFDKHTKIKKSRKRFEILHVAYDAGEVGHYCGAVKDGDTVHFFDSMGTSDFTHRFITYIKKRYGRVKIIQDYKDIQFQPYDCDYQLRSVGPSDHQYCYIEAFVYLSHKVLGTPMGPYKNRVQYLRRWISGVVSATRRLENCTD